MSMLSPDGNSLLLSALLALVLCGFLGILVWRKQRSATGNKGHVRKDAMEHLDTVQAWPPVQTRVMTTPMLQAHKVLQLAFPEHLVLAQMSLSRFLKVPTRNSYAEWMRRAGGLCVDLLVCDADAQVVAVVEIRQPVDCQNEKVAKRQQRMDRVLEAAGIPVHVWMEGQLPSPASARNAILGSSVVFTTRTGATLVDVESDAMPEAANTNSGALTSTWFETSRSGGASVLERPVRAAARVA
jgi:Protein of unknown function (DUF2726)